MTPSHCPACGAPQHDGGTCDDYFHQMLYWEAENPANGVVHHLLVLCYHLQHPHLYSREGLAEGLRLLVAFVDENLPPSEIRRRSRDRVDSGKRTWNIKATAESVGAYRHPVTWTMTAAHVVAAGEPNYCASVRAWARAARDALQASGNLDAK